MDDRVGLPDDFHHFVPAALYFFHGLDYARALEARTVMINPNMRLTYGGASRMHRVRQPAGLEQLLHLGDFLRHRGGAGADLVEWHCQLRGLQQEN